MKKLLLITLLIGGCATTPPPLQTTAYEREGKCKIDYRDQYWGDCYIRTTKADPNFSKVSAFIKKNYPSSNMQFNLLQYLNDDLVKRLAGNEITVDEANKSFQKKLERYRSVSDREYANVAREKEEERQKTALAWQQLGQALSESNAMLNQNNPAYNQNNSAPKNSGYLKDEYVSGFNKVCIYDGISGTFTVNISSVGICPLSAQQ